MESRADRSLGMSTRSRTSSLRKRVGPSMGEKIPPPPLHPQVTSGLRPVTRCRNSYVADPTVDTVLTSLLLQGRIGQDTLSAMIRQDETTTRSSRRRFYDVYTSQGDLLGKLRYPAGGFFCSHSSHSFDPHSWKRPRQIPHPLATGSRINSALAAQSPQCS